LFDNSIRRVAVWSITTFGLWAVWNGDLMACLIAAVVGLAACLLLYVSKISIGRRHVEERRGASLLVRLCTGFAAVAAYMACCCQSEEGVKTALIYTRWTPYSMIKDCCRGSRLLTMPSRGKFACHAARRLLSSFRLVPACGDPDAQLAFL